MLSHMGAQGGHFRELEGCEKLEDMFVANEYQITIIISELEFPRT